MRMRTRPLGRTPIRVSEIGFGVWTLSTGWWGNYTDEQACALLRKAFKAGINFFDAADTYGNGRAEMLLAKALGDVRDEIVIATKFGYDFYSHPGRDGQRELPQNWSPQYAEEALRKSLERLHTDRVDFYQLHNPRLDALQDPALFETMDRLKEQGMVRSVGAALGPALQERQIAEGRFALRTRRMAGVQIIYNMLEQTLGRALFPLAREHGGALLVRVPHASGMLEGSMSGEEKFGPGDHRSHRVNDPQKQQRWAEMKKKADALAEFLTRDMTLGQAALKFILMQDPVATVLPNIYTEAQLEEFVRASGVRDLTRSEMARIEQICAPPVAVVRNP
ncbi:MAG: aldo/keto reductase [Halobacteria archaeon]